jgi:hypothetical protein
MRVALIVVFVSALTTPSEAKSCMSRTEAHQHFGSYIYWHGKDHCWDATPPSRYHRVRSVQRKVERPKWHNSMSKMLADAEPVQAAPRVQAAPWVNRWVDIEPPPIDAPWVDIAEVAPPLPIIEREPEPLVTPRGLVMVVITIILTLTIFDVLFGGIRWAGPNLQRH